MLAEGFQPGLDVAFHAGRIERLGDEARRRVAGTPEGAAGDEVRARRLLRLLYEEVGFRGNHADYYDPRNSLLNEVLDRRLGIPITLAVILVEVARQAGVRADGIAFPGHFLVRLPGAQGEGPDALLPSAAGALFIDPFEGRLLDEAGLRSLHSQVSGEAGPPEARHLAPATTRQIITRMLNNLRAIHQRRDDRRALRIVLERLAVLTPDDAEVAEALAALRPPPPKAPPPPRN